MDYLRELQDELLAYTTTRDFVGLLNMSLAGSVAVNGHGNDIDVVLEANSDFTLEGIADLLRAAGWEVTDAELYRGVDSDGWFSAKKGKWNLLVSEDYVARLWEQSTLVCSAVRIMAGRDLNKDERVFLHRAVWGEL